MEYFIANMNVCIFVSDYQREQRMASVCLTSVSVDQYLRHVRSAQRKLQLLTTPVCHAGNHLKNHFVRVSGA